MKRTINFYLGLSLSLLFALFAACQEVAEPVTMEPVITPATSLRTAGEQLTLKDLQEWSGTLVEDPEGYTFTYPEVANHAQVRAFLFSLPGDANASEVYAYESDADPGEIMPGLLSLCNQKLESHVDDLTGQTTVLCHQSAEMCKWVELSGGGMALIICSFE